MKNTGLTYEQVVHKIYESLYSQYPGAKIEHNVVLPSAYGERQFDVMITFYLNNIIIRIPIECRDYASSISIEKIDAFDSKLRDVRANKGIMITKTGFQSGAIKKANDLNITLLEMDEAINMKTIDLDLSVVLYVLTPLNPIIRPEWNKEDFKDGAHWQLELVVNNLCVVMMLAEAWKNNTLIYNRVQGLQEIHIPGLHSPFYMQYLDRQGTTQQILLKKFTIEMDFEIKCYKCKLKDMKGAKGMREVDSNSYDIFIDKMIVEQSMENLTEINFYEADAWKGINVTLRKRVGANLKQDKIELFHN